MQVGNGLKAFFATIEYRTVSAMQSFVGCNLFRAQEQVPDQLLVLFGQIIQRGNRLSRHNQDMHRRLGLNFPERDTQFILVHHIRRDLSVGNLLEQGLVGHDYRTLTSYGKYDDVYEGRKHAECAPEPHRLEEYRCQIPAAWPRGEPP